MKPEEKRKQPEKISKTWPLDLSSRENYISIYIENEILNLILYKNFRSKKFIAAGPLFLLGADGPISLLLAFLFPFLMLQIYVPF